MKKLLGRTEEVQILMDALASSEAEMISIIGRRRVGKTFLVKQVYGGNIDFEATGVKRAPMSEQLQNFTLQLNDTFFGGAAILKPANWLEAFHLSKIILSTRRMSGTNSARRRNLKPGAGMPSRILA